MADNNTKFYFFKVRCNGYYSTGYVAGNIVTNRSLSPEEIMKMVREQQRVGELKPCVFVQLGSRILHDVSHTGKDVLYTNRVKRDDPIDL